MTSCNRRSTFGFWNSICDGTFFQFPRRSVFARIVELVSSDYRLSRCVSRCSFRSTPDHWMTKNLSNPLTVQTVFGTTLPVCKHEVNVRELRNSYQSNGPDEDRARLQINRRNKARDKCKIDLSYCSTLRTLDPLTSVSRLISEGRKFSAEKNSTHQKTFLAHHVACHKNITESEEP